MNPTIQTILQRRSIRFFTDKRISKEDVNQIIQAGNHAPTGSGQSWRFVVVEEPTLRKKLAERSLPRYKAWMEKAPPAFKEKRAKIDQVASDPIYYSAPTIIFVFGSGRTADLDCSLVCGNMMNAAQSLGIGSCWVFLGQLVLDDPEIRASFGIQEGEKVFGPIILGYPQENQPPRPPKKEPSIKWL